MQKGQALIFIVIGILVLVLLGGVFYLGRVTTPTPSVVIDKVSNLETFQQGWIKELKYPLDKYSLLWPDDTYIGSLHNSRSLLFQPMGVTLRPNDQYAKQNPDNPLHTLAIFVFNNKDDLNLSNAKELSERYGYISPGYLGFDKGVVAKETSVDGLPGVRLDVDCNGKGCFPGSEIFIIKSLNQSPGSISSVIFRITIVPSIKDNRQDLEEILDSIKFGP